MELTCRFESYLSHLSPISRTDITFGLEPKKGCSIHPSGAFLILKIMNNKSQEYGDYLMDEQEDKYVQKRYIEQHPDCAEAAYERRERARMDRLDALEKARAGGRFVDYPVDCIINMSVVAGDETKTPRKKFKQKK